jgi:hypothetical protein
MISGNHTFTRWKDQLALLRVIVPHVARWLRRSQKRRTVFQKRH